jgi:hypothetical protein
MSQAVSQECRKQAVIGGAFGGIAIIHISTIKLIQYFILAENAAWETIPFFNERAM